MRAAEALVELRQGICRAFVLVGGYPCGGRWVDCAVAEAHAQEIRRRLADRQPIVALAASDLVAVMVGASEGERGIDVAGVHVAGIYLAGPEPPHEARARHGRLIAALAEAIDTAWNEGLDPAAASPSLDREAGEGAGASLAASGRVDRGKVERALREAGWDAQADDIAEGAALGNVASEIRSRQCKRSDRALASMLEALAPADVFPGAVGGRDGWDLLQWRHYAEQLEEQVAHEQRRLERLRAVLEEE